MGLCVVRLATFASDTTGCSFYRGCKIRALYLAYQYEYHSNLVGVSLLNLHVCLRLRMIL
ncbi:hypothetical protein SAMN06265347_103137 [Halobellus salinus]|nr:hypothetical protein SAMN06265347_103137 [Halobellus salinus]